MRFTVFAAVVLVAVEQVAGGGAAAEVQPALDLIQRNFGSSAASAFQLSLGAEECAPNSGAAVKAPCFAITADDVGGKIVIKASNMSELTYGIGYYARFYCGMTVGWKRGGGSFTGLKNGTTPWPCHFAPPDVAVRRAVPYTFEDNVCTHSYSYAWYDEAAWTEHVDWMALSGVNVFYALTGQEEIQYKTFIKFGLKDEEIREFFNGPAYLTWSRGQSMQSVGSAASPEGGDTGLPRSWMQAQHALQKKILALTRPLGIIGVLPAFQGNMPPQIKKLHPNANMTVVSHTAIPHAPWPANDSTRGECAWVASPDPLFGDVADAWMQIMIADFGTDHWYQCDGFFTGAKPPWYEEKDPQDEVHLLQPSTADTVPGASVAAAPVEPDPQWTPVWKAAWGGMARTDPKAKWLYQGWAIRGWSDAAGAARIKALKDAVPDGQWIPLDMDISGIWRYWGNYSFFGAPFIWTTLHNMGGNSGMKGDMRMLEAMPSDALSAGASIIGTGATPEGINQNPAYYEYTFDTAWHTAAQPLTAWFQTYASRRYGNSENKAAANAWGILQTAVYTSQAGGWHDNTGVEWNVVGSNRLHTQMDTRQLFEAWQLLTIAGDEIDPAEFDTFNYDLVNVGREVLAQLITAIESNMTAAVAAINKTAALAAGATLMEAYADLDALVGCDYGFLLGAWLTDAKKWSNSSDAPESFYEWQARSQVSTWWPVPPSARSNPAIFKNLPTLNDYANKHWNGLVREFYAKRVQCYLNQVVKDLPDTPHPMNGTCSLPSSAVAHAYLPGYPKSLGSGGVAPPAVWPYNTSSFGAAGQWCCAPGHSDCGGVTLQNDRYEVRAGSSPIPNPPGSSEATSWPLAGKANLDHANMTHCVVLAEMDFTQGVNAYADTPTRSLTLSLSAQLVGKYAVYFL